MIVELTNLRQSRRSSQVDRDDVLARSAVMYALGGEMMAVAAGAQVIVELGGPADLAMRLLEITETRNAHR